MVTWHSMEVSHIRKLKGTIEVHYGKEGLSWQNQSYIAHHNL